MASATEKVLRALADDDIEAYKTVIYDVGDAAELGPLIMAWASTVTVGRSGQQVLDELDPAEHGAAWAPRLVAVIDAAGGDPDAPRRATRDLITGLGDDDLWVLIWHLADALSRIVGSIGGLGAWTAMLDLHEQVASTPAQRALAEPAAAVIGAVAAGHPREANAYLTRTIGRDANAVSALLHLWLMMAGALMSGGKTAVALDSDGTPDAVLALDGAPGGPDEQRTVNLIAELVAAIRTGDPQQVRRVADQPSTLTPAAQMVMLWQVALTVGHHVGRHRLPP